MAELREGKQKIDKQMIYFIVEIALVVGMITAFCIFRKEIIGFMRWAQGTGLIRPFM